MSIATHAELLTAVSDYIGKRSDLGAVDDDFVVLCEARLNFGNYGSMPTPPLRVRQMELRADLSPTGEYVSLPSDFLDIKYLKVTSTSPECAMQPMPSGMFDRKLTNSSGGTPRWYDIVGTEIRLNPVPTSATLEILYYQQIPALATTDPNWLLTANPAIYLYGTLLEAAIYIDQDEDIVKYGSLFSGLIQGMQVAGSDSSRGQPMAMQNPIRPRSGSIRA